MKKPTRPRFRPSVDWLESRDLPTSLALVVADLQDLGMIARGQHALSNITLKSPPFTSPPVNQTGVFNPLLTPTGVPTAKESKRETYRASFVGEYTIGPGRFSTEQSDFYFRGAGRTNEVLHSDIQMRIIQPTDPTASSTGEASLFDRNIDSNSDLGFDLYAVPQNVDKFGRPTRLTIYSLDSNVSSGNYVEGLAQGTIDVHYGAGPHEKYYAPPHSKIPGVLSQGTATLVINAQLYGIGTAFALHNVNINP